MAVAAATGIGHHPEVASAGPATQASLVADVTRIEQVLGWRAKDSTLRAIVASAWATARLQATHCAAALSQSLSPWPSSESGQSSNSSPSS